MDFQFFLANLVGKGIAAALSVLNRGGTALPGLWALKIDPQFVGKSAQNLKSIVVTGTNGKTTTARLISSILESNGFKVIHNRSGSNLMRGIASTLLKNTHADWAVFEADEAAFPEILTQTKPACILILNLFRDQMDRYGEIDSTAKKWAQVLKTLPTETKILLNVDDPALGFLHSQLPGATAFGLNDKHLDLKKLPHAADSIFSPLTGAKLTYEAVFMSHMGIYKDPGSDFARPDLAISAFNVQESGLEKNIFAVKSGETTVEIDSILPGVFNLYNLLAAAGLGIMLAVPTQKIKDAIGTFQSAFGRTEKVQIGTHEATLFLIKNPVGFDQIIRLLAQDTEQFELLIGINDNFADGTDISWLWDVDIESIPAHIEHITTTGSRANEMALRLKYANVDEKKISVAPNQDELLAEILKDKASTKAYMLLTYTTMMQFRELLAAKGLVKTFHED